MRWRTRLVRWLIGIVAIVLLAPPLAMLALRYVPPLLTPLMVIRSVEGEGLRYDWQSLEAISPHLARAVVASEDNRFCRHAGFDLQALQQQVGRALEGKSYRGASTISQQTVKNLFLWPGGGWFRKGAEALLTPQLELILDKQRIIELYLNIVELGPGIYGAEAAAHYWFDSSADALGPREAARLAVILPAPRSWSPDGSYADERATTIERRIGQLGPLLDCVT